MPSDDLLNSGSPSNSGTASALVGSGNGVVGDDVAGPGARWNRIQVFRPAQPSSRTLRASRNLRRRSTVAVLLSMTLIGSAVLTTSATAAPKPTVAQVKRKIEKLREQAEQATEQYNDTREELKSISVRQKAARVDLARQRVELAKAKEKVGLLASETYRRGEMSTLNLVLGNDPDAALAQAGFRASLGERQAASMRRLQEGEAKLAATEAELEEQQTKALAAQANLQKTKQTVKKRLAEANAQLATLTVAQRVSLGNSPGDISSSAGRAICADTAATAPSSATKKAITFACAQIGDPYTWAAEGPGDWDCSGYTMKAYAAAGISLPHSSRLQAGYGTRVSSSNLRAGDLVFFNDPISHVGIYLRDGLMVHAPHSGTVVKVAEMYRTPSAAVRLG